MAEERTFIRAVTGKYDEMFKRLYTQPRVFHSKESTSTGGPVLFNKWLISPGFTSPLLTQSIVSHIETLAPGGRSEKHGHMNSALLYILEGRGYEIHNRERVDWQAGDAAIVRNGCVHQHFNLNPDKPAVILILKSKPLFIFFNMTFQKTIEKVSEPVPGWEGWQPAD